MEHQSTVGVRRGLRPAAGRSGPDELLARATALLPESRRWCPSCDAPVGRARDGRPGRLRGTCAHCRRPFDLGPRLAPGTVLGRWRLTGLLARGGDWLWTAVGEHGEPAVVAPRRDGDAGTPALLCGRGHPALVGLREVVEHAGSVHLVLDPVDGVPARGPTDPATAAAVVLGIAPAVAHLHGLGLLHADLKPGNVLCGPGGGPVLMDLGSVRRLDDRVSPVWGTEGFLAPEISPGGAGPSVASEVYALGRTLDVLLGRPVRPQLAPRSAGAATPLDPVIARATAADPARRHSDVETLVADLRGALPTDREEPPGRPGVGGTAGRGAVHQDGTGHETIGREPGDDRPRHDRPGARPAPAPRGAFPT